ncbi:MAG: hypothetical protein JSR71_06095 [Proteobacteria bacterium]|nr:hypothetical protein [Pseudomonadota bacterium]MBS1920494.1 hypothetical protein [Bacteroidota bacterium]MBS1931107.1 hypothetical protein [Bacteroidota bacterium]
MKLALLLAEYLYTKKRLDLPGIGSLQIENDEIPETSDRKQPQAFSIKFQSDPTIKEPPELLDFIASKTGKMKALAAADLNSYIELAQQFLNTGNPFLLEGVGTITKLRKGEYEFLNENINRERFKDIKTKDIIHKSSNDSISNFSKTATSQKMKAGKLLPLLLILAGIGIAIFVGYRIYENRVTKNTENNFSVQESPKDETVPVKPDSSLLFQKSDSSKNTDTLAIQKPLTKNGTYQFVVEEAKRDRALLRYASLKSWGLGIQMETTDSTNFKLFFSIPSSVSDTAKTMDSLRQLYTPYWSKSYVISN